MMVVAVLQVEDETADESVVFGDQLQGAVALASRPFLAMHHEHHPA